VKSRPIRPGTFWLAGSGVVVLTRRRRRLAGDLGGAHPPGYPLVVDPFWYRRRRRGAQRWSSVSRRYCPRGAQRGSARQAPHQRRFSQPGCPRPLTRRRTRGAQVKRLKDGTARRFSSTTQKSLVADLRRISASDYVGRARQIATQMIKPADSAAKAADLAERCIRSRRLA
jgi:hypothetical protein